MNVGISTPVTIGQVAFTGAASNTLVLTTSAATPAGARVIVVAGCNGNTITATFTDSVGNTYTVEVTSNLTGGANYFQASAQLLTALPSGGTITATFSTTVVSKVLCAAKVTGLFATGALDQTATSQGSTAAWVSGTTATTTHPYELVFGGCVDNASVVVTDTASGGATELHDFATTDAVCLTTGWKIVRALATQSVAGTWTAATHVTRMGVATYKGNVDFSRSPHLQAVSQAANF